MEIRSADSLIENIELSDSVTTKTKMKEEEQIQKWESRGLEICKSPLFDDKAGKYKLLELVYFYVDYFINIFQKVGNWSNQ